MPNQPRDAITVRVGEREYELDQIRNHHDLPPSLSYGSIVEILCDALESKHAECAQLRAAAVELEEIKAQIIEIDKGSLSGIMNNWGSIVSLAKQAEDGRG